MFRFEPYMKRRRVEGNTYFSYVSLLIFVHTMGLNLWVFNTHRHPISYLVTVNHALYILMLQLYLVIAIVSNYLEKKLCIIAGII